MENNQIASPRVVISTATNSKEHVVASEEIFISNESVVDFILDYPKGENPQQTLDNPLVVDDTTYNVNNEIATSSAFNNDLDPQINSNVINDNRDTGDYLGDVSDPSSSSESDDTEYHLLANITRGNRGGRVRTRGGRLRLKTNVAPIHVRNRITRCTRSRGRPPKRTGRGRGGHVALQSSDDDDEIDNDVPQQQLDLWNWTKLENNDELIDLKHFPFTRGYGLQMRICENATPVEYLDLYMTDEIINVIVTETNRYAEQYMADHDAHSSYLRSWVPVTPNDIRQFIGMLVLMGIIYKPSVHMYWSTNELLSTPIFPHNGL